MTVDFFDATQRHWDDAGHLLADQRFANADHLFGVSAECALKTVMIGLGMNLRADGAPDEPKHRVHINKLWDEFLTFSSNRGGARYAAGLTAVNNPFVNWDVSQRYEPRSSFAQVTVQAHQSGAGIVKACLDMAILDGVVT